MKMSRFEEVICEQEDKEGPLDRSQREEMEAEYGAMAEDIREAIGVIIKKAEENKNNDYWGANVSEELKQQFNENIADDLWRFHGIKVEKVHKFENLPSVGEQKYDGNI